MENEYIDMLEKRIEILKAENADLKNQVLKLKTKGPAVTDTTTPRKRAAATAAPTATNGGTEIAL